MKAVALRRSSTREFTNGVSASTAHARRSISAVDFASAEFSPLSFNQKSLWFVYKLQRTEQQSCYHVISVRKFSKPLDADAVRACFVDIVSKNDQLRTFFGENDGIPYQRVSEAITVDFSAESMSSDGRVLDQRIHAASHVPFLITERDTPRLRVRLYCQPNGPTYCQLVAPHICIDGWSLDVIWDLFYIGYESLIAKKGFVRFERRNYLDFVSWQADMIRGERGQSLLQFWKLSLANYTPLNLPTEFPRPPVQTFNGEAVRTSIPKALAAAVTKISSREKVTVFSFLLSAFYVLLYGYTQESDLIIGTPVAGRSQLEFENIIGHFANVVALRSSVDPTLSFQSFAQLVQQHVFDTLSHADMPFALLVDTLQVRLS
jgi:hypothetical protein